MPCCLCGARGGVETILIVRKVSQEEKSRGGGREYRQKKRDRDRETDKTHTQIQRDRKTDRQTPLKLGREVEKGYMKYQF